MQDPSPHTVVDPPDLSLGLTLRGLFPLWWEQRRLVLIGVVLAFVVTALTLAVPLLLQRTIDDAIDANDQQLLLLYLAAITLVSALRFVAGFFRRFAIGPHRHRRRGAAAQLALRGLPPLSRALSTTATRPAR